MDSREERSPASLGASAGAGATGESLEQVRDLLFGTEMRALDRRVQRIEERLAREITALRSDLKQRLDSMQRDLAREVETLSQGLTDVKSERNQASEAAMARVQESAEAVEARLEDLRIEASAAHEELRLTALEDGREIRTEVAAARVEDQKRLARVFAHLARFMDEGANQATGKAIGKTP